MTASVLINPTPPAGSKDKVHAMLQRTEESFGFIPDGLTLYGISPPLLETFIDNFSHFMGHQELSPELFTMIRYLVSSDASCTYCIDFNGELLLEMGKTSWQLQAARNEINDAPLSDAEKTLLKIALASVHHPEEVNQKDLQQARNQGFSDQNIFDVVVAAASNNAFIQVLRTFNVTKQGESFA